MLRFTLIYVNKGPPGSMMTSSNGNTFPRYWPFVRGIHRSRHCNEYTPGFYICILTYVPVYIQFAFRHVWLWLGSWWRDQLKTFSTLPALCEGNPLVSGVFPSQRPVTRSLDVLFDLRLIIRLSTQSRRRWGHRAHYDVTVIPVCRFINILHDYFTGISTTVRLPKWQWRNYEEYHAILSWWRHQMETFSALLAICTGNSPVPGEFPAQRPVRRSFDVFFDLRLNKRLSKQSWGWWFDTLSRPLWRHCNDYEPVN